MIAAVVCTRDRPALLEAALASITGVDERIVVDSASVDAASVAAVARAAGFEVVRADVPGASRARNLGVAVTTAPVVAFTDDDCRPAADWASCVERAFASDGSIGFVTGAVLADREVRLPLSVSGDLSARRFGRGDDPTRCGHGANVAVRRSAFVGIGGFDVALGAGAPLRGAEDADLFWRLLEAGWAGVFDPSVVVTHEQWRTTGAALRTSYGYGLGLGAMATKGVRGRRSGAWRVLRAGLWDRGMKGAWHDLRSGYQAGALSSAVRAGGVAVGAVRGLAAVSEASRPGRAAARPPGGLGSGRSPEEAL